MATTIISKLLKTLKTVDRPTAFCVSETVQVLLPGLEVNGIGPVGLPVSGAQAQELVGVCHQAPYGKGEETLVDTSVRRVWALDSEHFTLSNPQWPQFIEARLKHIQEQLGLEDQNLACHLYQLLLYEPGSFFLPHQDGEKLEGMVATLVVVLPSIYTGGELLVSHCGHEETIDFSGPESAFNLHIAAFYADCEHEIKPVRTGYRLSLVYNITLAKSKKTIKAPQYSSQTAEIANLLQRWQLKDKPDKLVVLLDHEYTQKGLTPDRLKGTDRAKTQALFAAAPQAGCRAYLALLTLHELGEAEGDDYGGYNSRYSEPDDYTMGEIYDRSLTAKKWTDPHGNPIDFGELTIDEEEIVSVIDLTDVEPEEEFEGYTGNAGMELQRWYRHGAIVLWPENRHFEILCDAGIESALAGLQQMVKQWKGDSADGELKQRCILFAQTILARWPKRENNYIHYADDRKSHNMPALLDVLDDRELIAGYIGDVLDRDATEHPERSLARLCKRHGWLTYQKPLTLLLKNTNNSTITRNFTILESLCVNKDEHADRYSLCKGLAAHALRALKDLDGTKDDESSWHGKSSDRKELITLLFKSLKAVGATDPLAELVDHIVNLPEEYVLTTVQIPALFDLATWLGRTLGAECSSLVSWLDSCRRDLITRTENEPQPPSDWKRPVKLSCSCTYCRELSSFLNNPDETSHRFRLRKDRRQHLHQIIERHQCDTTHVTERRGSPQTLVCEKTNGTYERLHQAYKLDCEHLAKIEEIMSI